MSKHTLMGKWESDDYMLDFRTGNKVAILSNSFEPLIIFSEHASASEVEKCLEALGFKKV